MDKHSITDKKIQDSYANFYTKKEEEDISEYDSRIPKCKFAIDQNEHFHKKIKDKIPGRSQYNQCSHLICMALSQRIQTQQIFSWCQSAQWQNNNEYLCGIMYVDKQHCLSEITTVIRFHFQLSKVLQTTRSSVSSVC